MYRFILCFIKPNVIFCSRIVFLLPHGLRGRQGPRSLGRPFPGRHDQIGSFHPAEEPQRVLSVCRRQVLIHPSPLLISQYWTSRVCDAIAVNITRSEQTFLIRNRYSWPEIALSGTRVRVLLNFGATSVHWHLWRF